MKITIDLDRLLENQEIDQAEYDKFSRFSARGTSALAFNILIGFGVIAVGAAILALVPSPVTAMGLGVLVCAVGVALVYANHEQWMLLANICVVIGALLFGGGIIFASRGSVSSILLVVATFTAAGIFVRNRLLVVLAVLMLSSCLGAMTDYMHATYMIGLKQPTFTIVLFTVLSIGMYQLSKHLAAEYHSLAIVASRTGVFLVNLGFWIGSLWGDHLGDGGLGVGGVHIAAWVFAALWAVALVAAGIWAWVRDRRWLVNVVAVFGAIHFYTQWFETLGASAQTVLVAGLLALGFAVALRMMNVKLTRPDQPTA